MRLTLRTLLAYLDDTLEPAATKEIGQKLTSTEKAQELASRIGEVTRRRRLTAPPASGGDIDANDLAEYLDNTQGPEEIAELERVCLESDVYLADAAACHQILTMIGQPAGVSREVRQRMYSLVNTLESLPPEKRVFAKEPEKMPMPELWKRSLASRILGVTAIVAGVILIATLVIASMPDNDQVASTEPFIPDVGNVEQADVPEMPGTINAPDKKGEEKSQEPGTTPEPPPEEPPNSETNKSSSEDLTPKAEPSTENPPKPGPTEKGNDPDSKSGSSEKKVDAPPPAPAPGPEVDPNNPGASTPPPAPVEAPPVMAASYMSTTGILMNKRNDGQWVRVGHSSPNTTRKIAVDVPLLALPGYRAAFLTESGDQIELVDETELEFKTSSDSTEIACQLDRGRLLLTTAQPQAAFKIGALKDTWTIRFMEPESRVGFELSYPWKAGQVSQAHVTLTVTSGEVKVEHSSGEEIDLGSPVSLSWTAKGGFAEPVTTSTAVGWMEGTKLPILTRKASQVIDAAIVVGEPAVLRLVEFTSSERQHQKNQALACLVAVDRVEFAVETLSIVDNRPLRQTSMALLRGYVARGEEFEASLYRRLRAYSYEEAEALTVVTLLKGFTDEEAKDRKVYENLIEMLTLEELALRELAIDNLHELTGRDYRYNPDMVNQNALQSWSRQLEQERLPPRSRGRM